MNNNVKSLIFRFSNELRALGWAQFGNQYTEEHFKYSGPVFDGMELEDKRLLEFAFQLLCFVINSKNFNPFDIKVRRTDGNGIWILFGPPEESKDDSKA